MKYLLLLLAIVALVWMIRGTRRREVPPARPERKGGGVQPMVACRHCGVHLPAHEALPGRGGEFCGEAHRAEYEKQHPAG